MNYCIFHFFLLPLHYISPIKVQCMCRLQKQYDFFQRNKSGLMADYKNQVLVIADDLKVHAFPICTTASPY